MFGFNGVGEINSKNYKADFNIFNCCLN